MPLITEINIKCHGSITSKAISNPVNVAVHANKARVIVTKRTLFTRSATTPPHIEKSNIGTALAKVRIPNIIFESVNSCISQRRPANNI